MNCYRALVSKGLLVIGLLIAVLSGPRLSAATPYQKKDVVRFGAHKFHIYQLPLQSIIAERAAQEQDPIFEVTISTNNKGYIAQWAIRENKLFLTRFKAKKQGEKVDIDDIIEGARLPLEADWFTGKLELLLGDVDNDAQTVPVIVELAIDQGKVTNVSIKRDATPVYTLDGLPYSVTKDAHQEERVPIGQDSSTKK